MRPGWRFQDFLEAGLVSRGQVCSTPGCVTWNRLSTPPALAFMPAEEFKDVPAAGVA